MDVITLGMKGILGAGSVVGKKEGQGPIGACFDERGEGDDRFGMPTFEQAESEMVKRALQIALSKAGKAEGEIGALFAGDLNNQCISTAYGLADFDIPYFGLYGACSTCVEGLILSALALCANPAYKAVACAAASHNCTAERQFRTPIEYGGQRTPTAQWTVTGAGAFVIGDGRASAYLSEALPGRVVDAGITDLSNMGAAMAPAALDTLKRYFRQTGHMPSDFDMILTGDLGEEGHAILTELAREEGYDLSRNCSDCGLLIFDRAKQDVHAGGSGCGCSSVVLAGYLLSLFEKRALRDILLLGTGALMSPLAVYQGKSIPGIAHLIRITREDML